MNNQEKNNQSTWRSSFRWDEYHDHKPSSHDSNISKEDAMNTAEASKKVDSAEGFSYTLADVLEDQKVWSKTAGQFKRKLIFWRKFVLGLTIIGATLETLAAQTYVLYPDLSKICGVIGAIALVFIPVFSSQKLSENQVKAWVRARSISEALKKQVYLYLTGTRPYHNPSTRTQKLSKLREEIVSSGRDLYKATAIARSELATQKPTLPEPMDVKTYIYKRINDQIYSYYRPRSAELSRQVSLLRYLEFMMSLIAAALGVLPQFLGFSQIFAGWVAVITTAGVAITARISAGRFDHQVNIYSATADRLESLRNTWLDEQKDLVSDPIFEDQGDFIRQCEEAISVENQGWMAKFLQKDS